MPEDKIKIGDTVRMKSGGPLMTVEQITDDRCTCSWFDANQKAHTGGFALAVLEKDDGKMTYA